MLAAKRETTEIGKEFTGSITNIEGKHSCQKRIELYLTHQRPAFFSRGPDVWIEHRERSNRFWPTSQQEVPLSVDTEQRNIITNPLQPYLSPASFFCASSHVSPKTPRHMHHAPDRCNQVPNLRRRHTMKIKSDHRRNKTQTKPRTTLPPSPLPLMIHHRRAIIWHDRLGAHAQQQTNSTNKPTSSIQVVKKCSSPHFLLRSRDGWFRFS